MLVGLYPTALLERAEVDGHAAARDIEFSRDVGDASPSAVFRPDFVDGEEMMRRTVRQLVRLELLPGFHVTFSIRYMCLTGQTRGAIVPTNDAFARRICCDGLV